MALPQPHFATLMSCLEAGARGEPGGGEAGAGPGPGSGASKGFDGVVLQSALEGIAGGRAAGVPWARSSALLALQARAPCSP